MAPMVVFIFNSTMYKLKARTWRGQLEILLGGVTIGGTRHGIILTLLLSFVMLKTTFSKY